MWSQYALRNFFQFTAWVAITICMIRSIRPPLYDPLTSVFTISCFAAWLGASIGSLWRRIALGFIGGVIVGLAIGLIAIQQ